MTSSHSNELIVLERQFEPLVPHFAQVLGNTMPVERLMRTIMVSIERVPDLMKADRQTLLNSAMSCAVLGLEADGVTGQAYILPYKRKAQLIIGYKGYNTIGARANTTISAKVVREGDQFDPDFDEARANHKPIINSQGRIIAAWARAAAYGRPPVLVVMGIDEIHAIKAKSPGADSSYSPWNDGGVGYEAMCEKTPKRRLARSLPMIHRFQYAAAMEQAVEEQGRHAWISPDRGVVIEGEFGQAEPGSMPTTQQLIGQRGADGGQPAAAPAGPPLHGTADGGPDQSEVIEARARLKTAALNGSTADERIGALKLEWESLRNDVKAAITEGQGCPAVYKSTAKTGIAPQ